MRDRSVSLNFGQLSGSHGGRGADGPVTATTSIFAQEPTVIKIFKIWNSGIREFQELLDDRVACNLEQWHAFFVISRDIDIYDNNFPIE